MSTQRQTQQELEQDNQQQQDEEQKQKQQQQQEQQQGHESPPIQHPQTYTPQQISIVTAHKQLLFQQPSIPQHITIQHSASMTAQEQSITTSESVTTTFKELKTPPVPENQRYK